MRAFFIFQFLLVMVLFVGWIKCIVHLVNCDFEPSYKAEIIYSVGLVTGIGGVIGYIDFGK